TQRSAVRAVEEKIGALAGLRLPVPSNDHERRERGERRGLGAQDSRSKGDGNGIGRSANCYAFLPGKTAFRSDQQEGRAGRESARRCFPATFIGEVESARRIAVRKKLFDRNRVGNLWQPRPSALLCGLDGDRIQ